MRGGRKAATGIGLPLSLLSEAARDDRVRPVEATPQDPDRPACYGFIAPLVGCSGVVCDRRVVFALSEGEFQKLSFGLGVRMVGLSGGAIYGEISAIDMVEGADHGDDRASDTGRGSVDGLAVPLDILGAGDGRVDCGDESRGDPNS